jgi:hypothetical protein
MKRLFVCCDGTWNAPTDLQDGVPIPTNVVRFYNALAEQDARGIVQRRYYHPGIGTEEILWLERLWAGMTGAGFAKNVQSAYYWLTENYAQDDEIYLLGFSRGAFTVRALSGFIARAGLIRRPDWDAVGSAYETYRRKIRNDDGDSASGARIHFLGVWDTVGALGIPPDLPLLMRLGAWRQRFQDTRLAPVVGHAFHALAIDEMRRTFSPTLWTGMPAPGQEVCQMWFPGVHADVGGGYKETQLSDLTLRWMVERAMDCGAAFRPDMLEQIRGDHHGVLHDSRLGIYKGAKTQPRCLPNLDDATALGPTNQEVHLSVFYRRWRPPIFQAPYRESRTLNVGEALDVTIFARDNWNWTGLYVTRGASYRMTATGQWVDWWRRCGPEGYPSFPWQWPLIPFRRMRRARWLCLTGAVADFANPNVQGEIRPLNMFPIGAQTTQTFVAGQAGDVEGYFYAFANDREGAYGSNRGSIRLRIERIT